MTKELQKALIRTILCERDRIESEIDKERMHLSNPAANPTPVSLSVVGSLLDELRYCEKLLFTLKRYSFPQEVEEKIAAASPSLSPETVKIIRNSLEIHKNAAEILLETCAELGSDDDKKSLEENVSTACRTLDEFNATFPIVTHG